MQTTDIEAQAPVNDIKTPRTTEAPAPDTETAPEPVNIPAPLPNKARFQRKDEPKNIQFTGRTTATEAEKINKALAARRKQKGIPDGETYDITRFALDCIKYIESDFFQTFRTK
ncbi:MAG: hypothetical protein H7Y13_02405 [Sphingobacteriaceae bacterium]|nr:hypothetical protein [Sphingobacteriaceae bacterium]